MKKPNKKEKIIKTENSDKELVFVACNLIKNYKISKINLNIKAKALIPAVTILNN